MIKTLLIKHPGIEQMEFQEKIGLDNKYYIDRDITGRFYSPFNTIKKYTNDLRKRLIPYQVRSAQEKNQLKGKD